MKQINEYGLRIATGFVGELFPDCPDCCTAKTDGDLCGACKRVLGVVVRAMRTAAEPERARAERAEKAFRDTSETLVRVAQLLDGWHADGTAWSEWDESVRREVSALLAGMESGRAAIAKAEGR